MLTFQISEKGGKQTQHDFDQTRISIGRMKKNEIVLPRGNVSKKHAALYYQNSNLLIEDLDSTNGTYVNGRKVEGKQDITRDDKIYIGDFILKAIPEEKTTPASAKGQAGRGENSTLDTSDDESDDAPDVDLNHLDFDQDEEPQNRKTIGEPDPDFDELDEASEKSSQSDSIASGGGTDPSIAEPSQSGAQLSGNLRKTPAMGYPEPDEESITDEFNNSLHKRLSRAANRFLKQIPIEELSLAVLEPIALDEEIQAVIDEAVEESTYGTHDKDVERILSAEAAGLGVLSNYLDDDSVDQIHLHRHDYILLKKGNDFVVAPEAFSDPDFLLLAIQRLTGTRDFDTGTAVLRLDAGEKCRILTPMVTQAQPVVSIRKPTTDFPKLSDFTDQNALSEGMAKFLRQSVRAGRSILVSSPDELSKTRFLNALGDQIPDNERIVCVEEFSQLRLDRETAISLEASEDQEIDLSYLMKVALDLVPNRILLDECRHREAYDWVTGAATSTQGSMLTIRGTHTADALGRLENLCLLEAGHLSPRGIREQIVSALDIAVSLSQKSSEGFRVHQITEIQGLDLDSFRLNDIFHYTPDGTFAPTGYVPLFYEDLEQAGWDLDFSIFGD